MTDCQKPKPVVVFVDDDPMLLASTRRRMRKMASAWDIHYCNSAKLALELCETKSPDVLVSDMRMPEMDGVELLANIRDRYPDAVRIILSGQSEEEQLAEAYSNSHLFLAKPCDVEVLSDIIDRCINIREQLDESSVGELLSDNVFAEAPDSVREVLLLLRDANGTAAMVREALESQDDLQADVLRTLQLHTPTSDFQTLDEAINGVEVADLKSLYCVATLIRELPANEAIEKIHDDTLSHCLQVAISAAELASEHATTVAVRNDCFLGGLLHEYGKLVMAAAKGEEYSQCLSEVEASNQSLLKIERQRFGCTHTEAAAYVLMHWGFDPRVLECVISHSDEVVAAEPPQTVKDFVHAASVRSASGS